MPNTARQRIAVLGATGSIGTQTLDVVSRYPDRFQIAGLTAFRNMKRLAQQVLQFKPDWVVVGEGPCHQELHVLLEDAGYNHNTEIRVGPAELATAASGSDIDTVVVGIVGFAAVETTLNALKSGKRVLTANKETFVTAGPLVQPYLSQVIPLDSEHSAIFQCLNGCQNPQEEVKTIFLTASGGPFRTKSRAELAQVSVEQALKHPNWQMGPKVTIDSATMMNKGLELIEARWLFNQPVERLKVVIHPQSMIHSAVAFRDGSMMAQLGQPDMRVPIVVGLGWPERLALDDADKPVHLDLTDLTQLTFEAPDQERFPCLALAYDALEASGTMPTVLNAVDEVAVEAFLKEQIPFTAIADLIAAVMADHRPDCQPVQSFEQIKGVDSWARQQARSRVTTLSSPARVPV